ncbi:S-adenosyl-L-methionine-dependent methyltransferase [Chaetomium strumarium]|uniref:S-adenosyl-L-methionine-dependent methyltransferase n=1 Tax=Chaetomium strumarium TaxID=1170767 RepID=A0AAJ0H106_9PEZI|nr:S-adenosyl-L-methionine-dependent methyltransferase [Chaetomium strumarium]
MWHKALGDNLSFQFGLFDEAELEAGPLPGPVGPSEFRHFDRQLELAGLLDAATRQSVKRILDIGCGWGYITRRLAHQLPRVPTPRRHQHQPAPARLLRPDLPEDFRNRINLYLCNVQDVDLLPDSQVPYDLVVVRGVYTHFLHHVFDASVAQVAGRLRPGGILLISDTLYKGDMEKYRSPIPDKADRLACGNRKTPSYFTSTLEQNGLVVRDVRVMPSNRDVIHWFHKVRLNIEQNFPGGVTGPIQELHEMARSFTKSLAGDKCTALLPSVLSVSATTT